MQVTNDILNILRRFCQCKLSSSDSISSGEFLCYKDSPHFVTYRARIEGTDAVSVVQLITYLEKWVSANVVLIVMGQLLIAQSYCPVQIGGVNESQCILSTEMLSTFTTSTNSFHYLIAVILVVMVVALLVISMLIIINVLLLKKLKLSKKRTNEIE